MKKQIIYVFLLFILYNYSFSQNIKDTAKTEQVTKLFSSQKILPIKLSYSIKEIKKETNDSTYIKTNISYQIEDGSWEILEVELRRRGNFRLDNCYFPPIKVKIKKSAGKGTLFEGNKKLKLVLPCSSKKGVNDYIVKEYMAYKLYEIISLYHFKTRIVDISFTEIKDKKTKSFNLKGILVEDDKNVAKRHGGKVLKKRIHPMAHDPVTSVQNSFFQYLIGNTDYSTYAQHNEKLLFVNKLFVPLPYDFDMSGLVDTQYSVVSVINDEQLPISSVTDRLYRGFKRDPKVIQQVRKEFIDNEIELLEIADSLEPFFENPKEFFVTKKFISDFFVVMKIDAKFKKEITSKLRTK
ncbi:MAG: hypothetical protein ABFR32_01410 [Bacteroidota bacterium]